MAQRKAKRRKRQSRRGFVLAVCAVLVFAGLLVASAGLFFKITEVRVEGVSVINPDSVREQSEIKIESNIFLLDKFAVSRKIFASFPYAKEVTIRRRLPNVVVIEITEAEPACAFSFQGYYWVTDRDGRILERIAAVGQPGYPIVSGVAPLEPQVGADAVFSEDQRDKQYALYPLIAALEAHEMLGKVTSIDLTQSYAATFMYEDTLEVRIGMPDDIDYKIGFITYALEQLEPGKRAILDVSDVREGNAILIPED